MIRGYYRAAYDVHTSTIRKSILKKNISCKFAFALLYSDSLRGISAVGSAFEWHSKGRGFESHMLHYEKTEIVEYRDLYRAC